jgi:hypothetical protein
MERGSTQIAGRLPGCLRALSEKETHGFVASYLEDLADRILDPAGDNRRLID